MSIETNTTEYLRELECVLSELHYALETADVDGNRWCRVDITKHSRDIVLELVNSLLYGTGTNLTVDDD